jgi:hypothetical protein
LADSDNWQDNIGDVSGFTGAGTEEDPYQITNAEELAYLAKVVNEGNATYNAAYYELTEDIDLTAHQWTPLGSDANQFKGTFDGQNHEVSNVLIGTTDSPDTTYSNVGLFGRTGEYSTIENIGVHVSIHSSKSDAFVGGLVGIHGRYGTINNSYATGDVAGGDKSKVGGLVGYVSSGTISNSYATGDVIGGSGAYVGGLVGDSESESVNNSYATGNVTVGDRIYPYEACVGGLAGYGHSLTINNSYATGDVIGGSEACMGGY